MTALASPFNRGGCQAMSAADKERAALDLFRAALDVPEDERSEWLNARLGGDADLRRSVDQLFGALERTGVLDRSPGSGARSTRPRGTGLGNMPILHEQDIEPALRTALGERYRVIDELGRGGMSVVFLARERKHDRDVVIKVLKPTLAFLYGADRFEREVALAAQLSHPHIVGLIDSGSDGGLLYYVMPYVEGETLKDLLKREAPLPLARARVLLADIARALAHAHAKGVVHRDLKPGNVLCSGSHAYLMDFGIAKTLVDDGDEPLTHAGHVLGTPRYMAPEQAAGDPTVDHRADLYAWGLIAYEMIRARSEADSPERRSGVTGASSNLPRAVRANLRAGRPDVPTGWGELIAECLEPAADDRPADARAILRRLERTDQVDAPRSRSLKRGRRRTALIGLAALAGVVGWLGWSIAHTDSAPSGGLPQPIAVAPFVNQTGDASLDPLGNLAADWVTLGLQRTGEADVLPWPTVLGAARRAEQERDPRDLVTYLAEETGAGTVITGSFFQIEDQLQFGALVTNATQGTVLTAPAPAAASRAEPQRAIAVLRDRIMGGLALARNERLTGLPGLAEAPPTFEAYRLFDRGMRLYVEQDYGAASEAFAAAYRRDTTFVVSQLYEASTRYNRSEYASVDSLLRLLAPRRDRLSEYHDARFALIEAILQGEGERALRLARLGAELGPASRSAYNYAQIAVSMNRPQEAREALEAIEPDLGAMQGWAQYWTQLAHARHLLGAYIEELGAATEMRGRYSERRVATVLQARAFAASLNTAGLATLLDEIAALPPRTYWSLAAALVTAGEEMWAHGDSVAGQRYLLRAVHWLEGQRPAAPDYYAHRYWLASALYDLGRWSEASALFSRLSQDAPERVDYRGLTALSLARTVGADSALATLGTEPPYDRGDYLAYRARLEAVIGSPDRALDLLSEALNHGVGSFAWLHTASVADLGRLRGSARYHQLMSPNR